MLNYILTGWLAASKLTLPPTLAIPQFVSENKSQDDGRGGSCYCLRYAKHITNRGVAAYSASAHPVNTHTPRVGAIILLRGAPYSSLGHAGAIIATTKKTVTLKEVGYYGCNTVSVRTLAKSDPHIRGYYL